MFRINKIEDHHRNSKKNGRISRMPEKDVLFNEEKAVCNHIKQSFSEHIDELKKKHKIGKKKNRIHRFFSLKEELGNLKGPNKLIDHFEKHSELHDNKFSKQLYNQELPMKMKLINSELKEKTEINERLKEQFHHLSVLRAAILTKDKEKTHKIVSNFLKSEYAGVDVMVKELNDFKEKIDNAHAHYKLLINYMPRGLDNKIITEEKCDNHINSLHDLHGKQKDIFVNMSRLFLKMSKNKIK